MSDQYWFFICNIDFLHARLRKPPFFSLFILVHVEYNSFFVSISGTKQAIRRLALHSSVKLFLIGMVTILCLIVSIRGKA
jgi:hypothetical protein